MDDAGIVENRQAFGLRLLHARNARGWTQAELAKATGEPYISAPAISRLERGIGDPLQSTVFRLARALTPLPVHALYGSADAVLPVPVLTPTLAELLRAFARLPESLQRHALQCLMDLERHGLVAGVTVSPTPGPDHLNVPSLPS